MIRYKCDICGKELAATGTGRYIVQVEVYAAESPIEFTEQDLGRDTRAEMRDLIDQLSRANPDDIEDQTYRRFRFDLCAACQRDYLKNPLPRP